MYRQLWHYLSPPSSSTLYGHTIRDKYLTIPKILSSYLTSTYPPIFISRGRMQICGASLGDLQYITLQHSTHVALQRRHIINENIHKKSKGKIHVLVITSCTRSLQRKTKMQHYGIISIRNHANFARQPYTSLFWLKVEN